MRILFILTQSLESPGGGGRYFPLAKALVKKGYEVALIALHHNYGSLKVKSYNKSGVNIQYVGQMHVKKIRSTKYYYGLTNLLFTVILATINLTRAAIKARSDVIHICKAQPMNAIAARIAGFILRVPIFLDSDDYEALNNRFKYKWQQKIVSWFEDGTVRYVKGITVSNTFLADRFKSLGFPSEKILIIPHGTNTDMSNLLSAENIDEKMREIMNRLAVYPEDQVIIYIGSMSLTSHAVDLLLRSFKIMCDRLSNVKLVLVGGGEDIDYLMNLAVDLAIDHQVIFTGRVDPSDVPYYFRLADISVDPKLDTTLAHSTLSLKVFESIAAGVPCVAADTGDTKKILDSAGMVIKPGDIEALAEGLIYLLENPDTLLEMKMKTHELKKKYDWNSLAGNFSEIYNDLQPVCNPQY
jgi:glycosyltransferase involved in cell wall biosynthesis